MEFAERINDVGVIPLIRPRRYVLDPLNWRHCAAPIKTRPSYGVKAVSYRQDSRAEWNHVALKTSGIPGAVPSFVVMSYERRNIGERRVLGDHVCPNIWVASHDLP